MPTWLEVFLLSIVEGATEFLPVSSTGHMIIAADLLGMEPSEALSSFMVIIQSGAILAVITAYRQIFAQWWHGWAAFIVSFKRPSDSSTEALATARMQSLLICMAVIPFGVIGFINREAIKAMFSAKVVAYALICGGLLILLEAWLTARGHLRSSKELKSFGPKDSLFIGVGQCLALFPGFSRAAASILTARLVGYSRTSSAELSFLIGLPTIVGTGAYELSKIDLALLSWPMIAFGTLISWGSAHLCIKWFVSFLAKNSMSIFGWYRLALGAVILIYV